MVPRNSGPSIMPPRIMPVYPLYMSGNMNTPAFHVAGTATILPPTAIYGGPQKIGPNIVRKTREICRLCVYRRSYLLWPAVNSRNSHPGSRSGLFLPPSPRPVSTVLALRLFVFYRENTLALLFRRRLGSMRTGESSSHVLNSSECCCIAQRVGSLPHKKLPGDFSVE